MLSIFSTSTFASTPLITNDMNPLVLIYGQPMVSRADLLSPGQQAFTTSLSLSNTINVDNTSNESLFVDGETWRLNFSYLYAINENWMTRIRIPFIGQGGGFLDSTIDSYHGLFGFPEGERPNYPIDQLSFTYSRNNTVLLDYNQKNHAAGDISLDFARQLAKTAVTSSSLWFSLKLPSGNAAKLSGSNGHDLALWYAYDEQLSKLWSHYYNLGYLRTETGDVLPSIQKNDILFGTAGVELRYFKKVTLNVQLDFHSAYYDTATEFLGDSVQISSGGHIKIGARSRINIVVIEDIMVGASPDVTFQFGFSHQY